MKQSFEIQLNRPIIQAALVLGVAIVVMLLGWLLQRAISENADPLFPWSIGAAFMLFFALMNSLLSLRADSFVKYWQASMYSYMALAFGTSMAAWALSGVPIGEAGSYKWIYLVVSIGFIIFLTMVNFMKIIVRFAEKEEWNQPRRRK
jgi:drug/metabolite transporter (DMT)-like permease